MKAVAVLVLLCAAPAARASPITKVISMLGGLQQKIIGQGEAAQKVYNEVAEYCEDTSKDLHFEIKTGKAQVAELNAAIDKATADIAATGAKIEDLAAEISKDDADLKAATEVRANEAADFKAEDADLMETIDVLERAITVIERGSSLLQAKQETSLAAVLQVLVSGSGFSAADAKRLTALVQSSSRDDDSDTGAPDPEAYKGHSGGIISTLEGLLEKANEQLAAARSAETSSQHNFAMLEQSLTDEIKFGKKEMGEAKARNAASQEAKATAEGDVGVTSKSVAEAESTLADLHADCTQKSQDFEAETKSREEELNALVTAKKVISEATGGAGGAGDLEYGLNQVSLVQTGSVNFKVLRFVRDLARKQKSPALAQLAQRMSSMVRTAGSSEDIFAKVKALIKGMIERLLDEAQGDASHKAYCDKETAESNAKQEDLNAEIAKLTAKIDSMSAASATLKSEVKAIQNELAELARAQAEMDKIRLEEKALYDTNKPEIEEGVEGVQLALKVLKEYYAKEGKAHGAAEGAASGIIGMLEVVESDLTKSLAEMNAVEEAAVAEYERETKENEVLKATKEQDVRYKTKEAKELDTSIAETTSDREGGSTELAAVHDYRKSLGAQCIAKPESYGERAARRQAEIAGLKEALEILGGEALLQKMASTRRLRGPGSA